MMYVVVVCGCAGVFEVLFASGAAADARDG